jgi:putative nucleotidyltransferase with HDIG domain
MSDASETDQIAFQFLKALSEDLSRPPLQVPTFIDASLGARVALARKELSNAELARIVSGEPLLSARVVALANSAALNPGGRAVTDVRTAVTRIGQNAVRNVAAALALQQMSHADELAPFRAQAREIWLHSLQVAVNAKVLAHRLGKVNPDEALFAGLVHDLGKLYLVFRARSFEELARRPEVLQALVDEWHPGVGAALLQSLQLSEAVSRAVDEHELDPAALPAGSLSQLLSVANRCAAAETAPANATSPAKQGAPHPEEGLDMERGHAILAECEHAVGALLAALKA